MVIYDRPVRELLADYVAQLPQPFSRAQILEWFRHNYPGIADGTVSTHIQGMTDRPDRAANFPHLANYAPVLERVGRGLYRRSPGATRDVTAQVEHQTERDVVSSSSTITLVGCVKTKTSSACLARDLYRSPLFSKRRAYAEQQGRPWYIVSSRWGLVRPDEVIAPYDVYLPDCSRAYRTAWGEFVVAQLAAVTTSLQDLVVEVHAGDAYVSALRPPLERTGAHVVDAVPARSMGETLAWYDQRSRNNTPPTDVTRSPMAPNDVLVSDLVRKLLDRDSSISAEAVARCDRSELDSAGLYLWWVDKSGVADLSRGLGHPLSEGPIYGGQAGATRWPSGTQSTNTLWDRLVGMHLTANASMSTFRKTLAAVLRGPLSLFSEDDERLTRWMNAHVRVVAVPVADRDGLAAVEKRVLEKVDPPLNLRGMESTPLRKRISQLRREAKW